jgi:kumamolisin
VSRGETGHKGSATDFRDSQTGEGAAWRSLRSGGRTPVVVNLFRHAHEEGEYRGRSGSIHVPAELDGIEVGVYGLDNRKVIRRRKRRMPARLELTANTASHRGFFPADLAKLYRFPAGDGEGQSIGILEFGGGVLPDDLELFCKRVGVAVPKVVPVSVDHAATNVDDDAAVEVMLDIEVIAGVCPKATIPVYFGPDLSERSLIDTLGRAIHNQVNNPFVLSISWATSKNRIDGRTGRSTISTTRSRRPR